MSQALQARGAELARSPALRAFLADALGASAVRIGEAVRLSGGGVQENWRLALAVEGGAAAGALDVVLRTDPDHGLAVSLDRTTEFAVLSAAHAAGVPVARPIARCGDRGVIGQPFLVQAMMPGVAQSRRIVRDPGLAEFGDDLARSLGGALGRLHAVRPPRPELAALPLPMLAPARAEVAKLRAVLDPTVNPRPALEYVLCWLEANAPPARPLVLVHGDFRTGNYLIKDGRLTAVLDWEFAHWGDAYEDIGWFCARCWRFGNVAREAGGIADRAPFYAGYERETGDRLDPRAVAYWEVLAAAKWAAIATLQGERFFRSGGVSLEQALTGLMVPELELEALDGITSIARARS